MRTAWLLSAVFLCLVLCPWINADDDFVDVDGNPVPKPGEEKPKDKESDEKDDYEPIDYEPPKVTGSYHFYDAFLDKNAIGKRWHKSAAKKDDVDEAIAKYNGEWAIEEPEKVAIRDDYGLVAKSKARLHAITAMFDRPFNFQQNKALVVQYEVKFQEGQECGGGYMKLLTAGAEKNLQDFRDKTPYTIMFGPDKCGLTSKVHFILKYINPKNGSDSEHHAKQSTKSLSEYFDSHKTHLYTLIIKDNDDFRVLVDNSEIMSGSLLKDLEPALKPPRIIDDPNEKKPEDWDEREKIVDPDAKKPDDWDEDAPKEIVDEKATKPDDWLEDEEDMIPDSTAKKPDDWDNEMDGEWQAPSIKNPKCEGISGCGKWNAPMIANPNYKGKWKAPKMNNPDYKGKWAPQQIENPHFFEPEPFKQLAPITAIGFELWTMSANILFDNIIVTDSESVAKQFAADTYTVKAAQEAKIKSSSSTVSEDDDDKQSEEGGIISNVLAATEERPWLWAVLVLAALIPVIGIAYFCFGKKTSPSTKSSAYRKKHDVTENDDDVPDLVNDDEDEELEEEEEKQPVKENGDRTPKENRGKRNASGDRKSATKKAVTKDDLEDDDDDEEVSAHEDVSPKASPGTRRVRQRRQD